jgi:hypothetical protein
LTAAGISSDLDISFGTTCPEGYDSSQKGCSISVGANKYCENYDEEYCSYYGGTMKDLSTCFREAGFFIYGSCLEYDWDYEREICTPNVSKMICSYSSVIFTEGARTCPTSPIGSCSYSYDDYFECQDNVSQIMCYDDFVAGGTCPLGACEYYDYDSYEYECVENVSKSECYDGYDSYDFYSGQTCPVKYCMYYDYDDEDYYCEEMIPGDAERVQNAAECEDEGGMVAHEDYCEYYDAIKYSPLSSPKKK